MQNVKLSENNNSIIKVIGVGGGGSNAVTYMYKQGIKGVDFAICNTDAQALNISNVPNKLQLGINLTMGHGAGSTPQVGKDAALENIDKIKNFFGINTRMVFITAGMGGGTGTGASPVIAQIAKEMKILTVGIVTMPFSFEGKKRKNQAYEGIMELKKYVDTLLIISNDRLRSMFGNLSLSNAFSEADNILTTASKGIAEIITLPGYINVDFEDVRTVMSNGGVAIMGSYQIGGENRAHDAVEGALHSPLLNDNKISGAKYILLNITSGNKEVLLEELTEITDYIQEQAEFDADIIWGHCYDEELGDDISVTVIATGFNSIENNNSIFFNEKKDNNTFNVIHNQYLCSDNNNNIIVHHKNRYLYHLYKNINSYNKLYDLKKHYSNVNYLKKEPAYKRRKILIKDFI
ncbi:MAG: cell division protein FtsZ [Bacteroides sp.]|nr:MAG: cell division protein FtsZ [Bacteroides sp.]